nr:tetratricopeptide repeat protein [Pleurocapsa sp. MO_226.B13]
MKTTKLLDTLPESANFSSVEWLTERAVKKHKEGKAEEAIAFYLELIELDSHQPAWVYANVITLFSQARRFDEALKIAQGALNIYSDSDEIYRALGLVHEQQENDSQCIENYQKAIELKPEQPDWLYCNLAKKLLQTEQSEEAINISKRGIIFYNNFHYLYYILGNALSKQEQWDEAIAAYRRVQELNPNWSEIEEKLNLAVYKKNQAERAIYNTYHFRESSFE